MPACFSGRGVARSVLLGGFMTKRRSLTTVVLGLLAAVGCSAGTDDGADRSNAQVTDAPSDASAVDGGEVASVDGLHVFSPQPEGGGIFGEWIVDEHGLPAFSYTLDERNDARAKWPNSEDIFPIHRERRDHFFVTGNDRVNLMAVDDGYVQLFGDERGPTWMNRFAEDQHNLGGGFSYIHDGAGAWASAFRYAPSGATTKRVFGIGYYETTTKYRDLSVRHRIHAPMDGGGDAPFVIDEVTVTNESPAVKDVRHFEYWDVNRHQLLTEWARTGLAAGPSDRGRDGLNAKLDQAVTWDAPTSTLRATMTPRAGQSVPAASAVSAIDWYPPPVFLTKLSADASAVVDEVYTDQRSFFGGGTPASPAAVSALGQGQVLGKTAADGQPAMLAMRSTLHLAPGQKTTLRFAYGYEPTGKPAQAEVARSTYGAHPDPLGASLARWKERLAYVDIPGSNALMHRELAWRSHTLLGHTVKNDYYGERYTAQGSAYLYLHGADGVPRDQALFALATTYFDEAIAKGNLRMIMGVTDAVTGQKAYSFTGYGVNEGATLHEHPSDLDIYFFLGLSEYLAATGDRAFLAESVDFHPKGSASLPPGANGKTVLDHVRVAFRHLKDKVGKGDHGLIRISDGDWSDGVSYEDLSPSAVKFTIDHGESIPNTQLALVALPLMASQIASLDPALSAEMQSYAASLVAPVKAAHGTKWFGRAWVRNSINQSYLKGTDDANDPYRASFLDLEAQPWGILANVLDASQTKTLLDEVESRLDNDSAIGPRLRQGGQVWPAISQVMTWAYARTRPASAWRSLDEHLYATHAKEFPAQWVGILSGPDGFDSSGSAGGTWVSPVTPMTDFPVANMNPEAMMFVGLLRAAGVEPLADGLLIAPRNDPAHASYVIDVPLLRLDVSPKRIQGEYRAKNDGTITLRVAMPTSSSSPAVKVDGVARSVDVVDGRVALPLTLHRGASIRFEITF